MCLTLLTCATIAAWVAADQVGNDRDIAPEAMDMPLTLAHLLLAHQKGIPLLDYARNDPIWEDMKRENPTQMFAYFGNRFYFEFFALQAPLLSTLYVPFVKVFGVTPKTVMSYSAFFATLAMAGTVLLAVRMQGIAAGFLAPIFLLSSLIWVIHIWVGYQAWMPCVALMVALAAVLHEHLRRPSLTWVAIAGGLLGLMYLAGWLAVFFGGLISVIALVLADWRAPRRLVKEGLALLIASGLTVTLFVAIYAAFFRVAPAEVYSAIHDVMFGRFTQGAVPGSHLSTWGRAFYALKCLFVNSRTSDHLDKCLEGRPGVPWFFTLCFIAGVIRAGLEMVRRPSVTAGHVPLLWTMISFAIFLFAFQYAHRYALLVLPAMAILATYGALGAVHLARMRLGRAGTRLATLAVAAGLAAVLIQTGRDFHTYLRHKPPNFEVDRLRGHRAFSNWLKEHHHPGETLVILGDPIFFNSVAHAFNTFGWYFPATFWSDRFCTSSSAAQVRAWEKRQLPYSREIVLAFSSQLLGDPRAKTCMNDWRPFLAAHPGIHPAWTYSYDGRSPSILVYEIGSGK